MNATIYLVRHGETSANKNGIVQGHSDYQLNDHGRQQAQQAALALADVKFDSVFSSDLSRAFETASIIVSKNKSFGQVDKITKWKSLRERCFGILENKTMAEYALHVKVSEDEAMLRRRIWSFTPEGGESMDELFKRAKTCFNELCHVLKKMAKVSADPTILVVSHGGLIREFVHLLVAEKNCQMPPETSHRAIPGNTCITMIHVQFVEDGNPKEILKCSKLYDISHLENLKVLDSEAAV